MHNKKIKKLIASVIISVELLALPLSVFAQAVPACDPGNGSNCATGYISGIAANTVIQTALGAASAANLACETVEQKYFNAVTTKQLAFSGLSIIGGSGVQLAQYSADLLAIDGPPGDLTIPPLGFIPCRKFVLSLLDKIQTPNTFLANLKQTIYDSANKGLVSLKAREESIKAKQANATQGFWKTLVFNILIKTSKSVVNTLVGKLVSSYKINNVKQYADSVATLMYDNQFIRDNFPDAQGQLMARAILENPEFRYKVPPGFFIAADQALGFNPRNLDPNDPNFYSKMANIGSTTANPYYQHSSAVGRVDQSRSMSLAYSQNQISQSNGYKAPVSCAGSLAQQKSIDGQTKATNDLLQNRRDLLKNLTDAKQAKLPVKDSDIAKAQADVNAAENSWNNLPYTAAGKNGAGNNTEGNLAIVMCEAISSPAILINQGVDAAFKSVGAQMGQYSDNNLPGFISLIGNVASQIGSSLILGGVNGAKGAALMNEGRVVNGVLTSAADYAASQATADLATKGITTFSVDSNPSASVKNGYTASWEINKDIITSAAYVTIQGPGISTTGTDPKTGQTVQNRLPLSGSYNVITSSGGNYIITVYDANGRAITSGTITLSVSPTTTASSSPVPASGGSVCGGNYSSVQACINQTNDSGYCSSVCSTAMSSPNPNAASVAGAYTQKAPLEIRGPAPSLSLRQ